jgi:hypothetical protein
MTEKPKNLQELTHQMFTRPKEIRAEMERLLHFMKSESGKSPFDEWVIDFLDLLLEYEDRRLF